MAESSLSMLHRYIVRLLSVDVRGLPVVTLLFFMVSIALLKNLKNFRKKKMKEITPDVSNLIVREINDSEESDNLFEVLGIPKQRLDELMTLCKNSNEKAHKFSTVLIDVSKEVKHANELATIGAFVGMKMARNEFIMKLKVIGLPSEIIDKIMRDDQD